jgi:predicted methyltransferase
MRRLAISVAVVALTLMPARAAEEMPVPDYVAAAVSDKDRPKEDTDRDVNRHPAEVMALAGVKAGDRAVDVGPGSGYYTRILSRIVGDKGKVYAFNPTWIAEKFPKSMDGVKALASAYANVEGAVAPMEEIKFDVPVDLVLISLLYHDQVWQKTDVAKMNKAVFDALKPGGIYFVIDHVGPGVTTVEQIDKLHRIDPALVKSQVLAAGFELAAESNVLRNPADDGTVNVFDPSIRGKTDRFVYKFRKPAK